MESALSCRPPQLCRRAGRRPAPCVSPARRHVVSAKDVSRPQEQAPSSSTRVSAAASTADPEQQLVAAAAADREQKPVAALPAAAAAAAAAEDRRSRLRAPPGPFERRRRQQLLPTVVYDPAAAEEYFNRRPLLLAGRIAKVTRYLVQFGIALASSKVDSVIMGVKPEPGMAAPELVLQQLAVKLGPTFVKLAQTLSMRADLIGEGYAAALAELQDNVAPFDSATAMAIVERELGAPPADIFTHITPEPIASASLGQVYRATLAADGQEVAVKVQRPGVESTIALDVYMLRQTIGLVQKAAGIRRDLRVLADEVGRSLYEELDFRVEAANAAEFRRAHAYIPFITVPGTMWRYTTKNVLVSEWVDGRSPSQLLAAAQVLPVVPPGANGATEEAEQLRRSRRRILSMVRMGTQCSLAQLLVTGVMHGDPHSGNLLLRKADGKLCYLDFGLVVRVTPEHRQAMMSALVHLGLGEWERLVADMEALDLLKPGTNKVQLAIDLRNEFTAVMAEADGKGVASSSSSSSSNSSNSRRGSSRGTLGNIMGSNGLMGSIDAADGPAVASRSPSVLPLLSLTTTALSFTALTRVLFRIAFRYKFLLPAYFPLVLRAVASLEGVALSVDKNFKLISAGMPVVLNQLLSDRRPAAQALLRELLLNNDGTLRSDATTQQILQVWLAAADQVAAVAAGDSVGEGKRGGSSLAASLSVAGPATDSAGLPAAAAEPLGPTDTGLDLAALLLDGRNAPLRRIAMDANPAMTISGMEPAMKQQLREILVDALGSGSAASRLRDSSAAARAQRKRLFMLFRSSLDKVKRSPPRAIFSLLLFTASVLVAVARSRVVEMLRQLGQALSARRARSRSGSSSSSGEGTGTAAAPVPAV